MAAEVTGLRSLGRGVAYVVACPGLAAVRAALATAFHGQLTAQDRQAWRPHVTVQNKVTPPEAAALLATLQDGFQPFTVGIEGLQLWRYDGGPWTALTRLSFA